MKKIILTLVPMLCSNLLFSQTQAEMNKQAIEWSEQADAELEEVYRQILTEYASDTTFIDALEVSQEHWYAFRTAEIRMKYPAREPGWYGSMHSMCLSMYKKELTDERIMKLKQWLDDSGEGDGCAGSLNR